MEDLNDSILENSLDLQIKHNSLFEKKNKYKCSSNNCANFVNKFGVMCNKCLFNPTLITEDFIMNLDKNDAKNILKSYHKKNLTKKLKPNILKLFEQRALNLTKFISPKLIQMEKVAKYKNIRIDGFNEIKNINEFKIILNQLAKGLVTYNGKNTHYKWKNPKMQNLLEVFTNKINTESPTNYGIDSVEDKASLFSFFISFQRNNKVSLLFKALDIGLVNYNDLNIFFSKTNDKQFQKYKNPIRYFVNSFVNVNLFEEDSTQIDLIEKLIKNNSISSKEKKYLKDFLDKHIKKTEKFYSLLVDLFHIVEKIL